MRTVRRVLVAMAVSLAGRGAGAATAPGAPDKAQVTGSPSWAANAPSQAFGFSAPTVTQSGVTYAPADSAVTTPGEDAATLANLPAWDTRAPDPAQSRGDLLSGMGLSRFEGFRGTVVWALLITGFAIIGGALRGFFVLNRRLNRLRSEEDPED